MYGAPLVPADFVVPRGLETARLRLRPLTVHDAVKDYEAVMTSAGRLRTLFRPGGSWPEGLTLEQDLIELAWHQVEFQKRTSFAYTVVSLDETRVLGCLSIPPSRQRGHDAVITMWVRASEAGLDGHLYETVVRWVRDAWPFENPGYPGRAIPWETWDARPES